MTETEKIKSDKSLNEIWNKCLEYNIEQKPEEYLALLEHLILNNKRSNCLEIGANYGGTSAGFCCVFERVFTIDVKYDDNFEKIKKEFGNFNYIISNSYQKETYDMVKNLDVKFDFIFIDGDHGYDGVCSDYNLYKEFLADGGFIGFHDIYRTKLTDDLGIEVHRLWEELKRKNETLEFFASEKNDEYSREDFFHHIMSNHGYGEWGGIGLITNHKKIMVFSHNYLFNNWKYIVTEQLDTLKESRLYFESDTIHYFVYDTDNHLKDFFELVNSKDVYGKIKISVLKENAFEFNSLINLQNVSNLHDGYVLYYHTKGVTSRENHTNEYVNMEGVESWRKCLEYFNLEKWENCVEKLKEGYDVVGCLFQTNNQFYNNYFAGNFWWTKTDYIRGLPNMSVLKSPDRMMTELWIGLKLEKWFNFYDKEWFSVYNTFFDPKEYRN
jgi:predicted O-methyltransferase YrrM